MADVLFIKTSSLGDVIHHMPALTEARARRPDARFAWVVEEAFAPLVRLHPAVAEVIPVAAMRTLAAHAPLLTAPTRREAARFLKRVLRARAYDAVIDTQGLDEVGADCAAAAARGRRHGYDPNSIKLSRWLAVLQRAARCFEWKQHAIARNRVR